MPRLRYIEENEKTAYTRELIESAKRTGAPDPRVVSLMMRSKLWHRLGRVLEQATVSGRPAAQAQGDVPHQDFRCTSMRLLLDRSFQHRQG
jgi:hypothetical protein